jgi:hypothetical protein
MSTSNPFPTLARPRDDLSTSNPFGRPIPFVTATKPNFFGQSMVER